MLMELMESLTMRQKLMTMNRAVEMIRGSRGSGLEHVAVVSSTILALQSHEKMRSG